MSDVITDRYHEFSICATRNFIFVVGGYKTDGKCETLDVFKDQWKSLPRIPDDFYQEASSIVINKRFVFCLGGRNENG